MRRSTVAVAVLALCTTTLSLAVPASADDPYVFRAKPVVIGTPIAEQLSLPEASLPTARVGAAWGFDFGGLDVGTGRAPVTFAGGSLPAWMTLTAAGQAAGTPTVRGTYSLPISATRGRLSDARTYEVRVTDPRVTLATATLPDAKVGVPWSYDFGPRATPQDLGAGGLAFSALNNPAWLNVAPSGLASGTPTAAGDVNFQILATNVDAQGQQTYTIKVGNDVFTASQISLGGGQSCAIVGGGEVKCWGQNNHGQLGDNSTTTKASPMAVSVANVSGATHIAAGLNHTCAIVGAGSVKCWGRGAFGQLGYNDYSSRSAPLAAPVANVGRATAIAVGDNHTCVVEYGGIKCWGRNADGQLGIGGTTDVAVPPAGLVANVSGATAVTAGMAHTCALVTNGQVKCWGSNGSGQSATGSSLRSPATTTLANVNGATAIVAGQLHTCALAPLGVKCWGSNQYGQLGNGGTTQLSTPPVAWISGTAGALAVDAGSGHTCALASDRRMLCWGENHVGQLGRGSTSPHQTNIVAVSNLANVSMIAVGHGYSCGVVADGMKCWGSNYYGQLGLGTTGNATSRSSPGPSVALIQ